MNPLLRVEGLSKRYGARPAVVDVSFTLAPGEVVAFLGRNGAGKSTVLKILCGLVRPDAGQAWLDGVPLLRGIPLLRSVPLLRGISLLRSVPLLDADPAGRRALGAAIEAPRFYPHLSGRHNLSLVARLLGVEAAVPAMLERVGLADRAGERFGRYSMGMKQRLGLAAAFVHRPRLVLLDEPTAGLDPVGYAQIHELIRTLVRERGAAVLLCTHQLAEAAALCERALAIEAGRLVLNESLSRSEGLAAVQALFDRMAQGGAA
jgi:ABC-2 type transport system ATP-binding protein